MQGLFENKVDVAIERIRQFEPSALDRSENGYWLAFSGGKDSIVIYDLAVKAGVKFEAHFNVTTVDPPELMRFIREHYRGKVKFDFPEISMHDLIVKKMMPPTRLVRFCCERLKERGGSGRLVITGIRWAESNRRSKRAMSEQCMRDKRKFYLHPIVDWSDADIWNYIGLNNIPYCRLYDEGFTRIGCIGCPMSTKREQEFRRYPKIERMYRDAFAAAAAANIESLGTEYEGKRKSGRKLRWDSGDDMFRWWMEENSKDDESQPTLFD